MNEKLIASCGFNCALCAAYQGRGQLCQGCKDDDGVKQKHCYTCVLRKCYTVNNNDSGFCYECDKFPCRRLKDLDAKYQRKHQISMIDNLNYIKEHGLKAFIESEQKRWTCVNCGETICIHKNACVNCGTSIS